MSSNLQPASRDYTWVRDRSGYEANRIGCRNADVVATGGSRSSSAVTARFLMAE